ncbi:hypothetical protein PAMP_005451 [Pampus punctatissimus]
MLNDQSKVPVGQPRLRPQLLVLLLLKNRFYTTVAVLQHMGRGHLLLIISPAERRRDTARREEKLQLQMDPCCHSVSGVVESEHVQIDVIYSSGFARDSFCTLIKSSGLFAL